MCVCVCVCVCVHAFLCMPACLPACVHMCVCMCVCACLVCVCVCVCCVYAHACVCVLPGLNGQSHELLSDPLDIDHQCFAVSPHRVGAQRHLDTTQHNTGSSLQNTILQYIAHDIPWSWDTHTLQRRAMKQKQAKSGSCTLQAETTSHLEHHHKMPKSSVEDAPRLLLNREQCFPNGPYWAISPQRSNGNAGLSHLTYCQMYTRWSTIMRLFEVDRMRSCLSQLTNAIRTKCTGSRTHWNRPETSPCGPYHANWLKPFTSHLQGSFTSTVLVSHSRALSYFNLSLHICFDQSRNCLKNQLKPRVAWPLKYILYSSESESESETALLP